eukprot:gene17085-23382_t
MSTQVTPANGSGDTLRHANREFTPDDVRYYMYATLQALDFMHSRGYMHRDIKASNILVNHSNRQLRLADFNVAERYQAGEFYTIWVMSPGYRSPELLVDKEDYDYSVDMRGFGDYDYSVDMWGFGVLFGKSILRNNDLFDSPDNVYDSLISSELQSLPTTSDHDQELLASHDLDPVKFMPHRVSSDHDKTYWQSPRLDPVKDQDLFASHDLDP